MLHVYGGLGPAGQQIKASVAAFLIARSALGNSLLRLSSAVGQPYNWPTPPWSPLFELRPGAPLADGAEAAPGVFVREYERMTVTPNCSSFKTSFKLKHDDGEPPPTTTNSSAGAAVYLLLPASTVARPASDAASLAAKEVRRYVFAATGALLPLAVASCAALGDEAPLPLPPGSVLLTSTCAEAAALSGEQHAVQQHISSSSGGGSGGSSGTSSLVLAADDAALLRAAYRWSELVLGVHFGIGGDTVARRSRREYERRVAALESVASAENGQLFAPAFATRGIQPFHGEEHIRIPAVNS